MWHYCIHVVSFTINIRVLKRTTGVDGNAWAVHEWCGHRDSIHPNLQCFHPPF